jgi:hypothetical protein
MLGPAQARAYHQADCIVLLTDVSRRVELVELIPELEEVTRGTESLPVENLDRLDSLDSFQCPLTMEVITDPVITADGQTY